MPLLKNKVQVTLAAQIYELVETSQDIPIRFAFVNKCTRPNKYYAIHELVKCRDYLNDVLWAEGLKIPTYSQYGFRSGTNEIVPIEGINTTLVLSFNEDACPTYKEKFVSNISQLNVWEKKVGLNETVVYSAETSGDCSHAFVLEADKCFKIPMLNSIYTLLIREMCKEGDLFDVGFAFSDAIERTRDGLTVEKFCTLLVKHQEELFPKNTIEKFIETNHPGIEADIEDSHWDEFCMEDGEYAFLHDINGIISFCGAIQGVEAAVEGDYSMSSNHNRALKFIELFDQSK